MISAYLKEKKILIISPQTWSNMRISKHHYAVELAARGNEVYFLNPPSSRAPRNKCHISHITPEGIRIIDYLPSFPMRWKKNLRELFNIWMKGEAQKIVKLIGGSPDIVWDFDSNRQFADLNWFRADLSIYHPVDITSEFTGSSKNAHVIFSVSDLILDQFRQNSPSKYFINHGLCRTYYNSAQKRLHDLHFVKTEQKVHVGYFGNLTIKYLHHPAFRQIIAQNPEVQFHIWGPHDTSRLRELPEYNDRIKSFIEFLKQSRNVTLYGTRSQEEIIESAAFMDAFIWCYDTQNDPNKGSNSHKLLEYLSTGKVLISTPISLYRDISKLDLIVMSDPENFTAKFKETISNLSYYNGLALQEKRIRIALENSYEKHLHEIDLILQSLNKNGPTLAIKQYEFEAP